MRSPRKQPVQPPAWTPRRIAIAAALALALVGVAVGGFVYWRQHQPLPEPTSAAQAMAHVGSARFNRMPEERQRQYLSKTWSLMRELPREERRALRERYGESERVEQTMSRQMHQRIVERAIAFNQASPEARQAMLGDRPTPPRRNNDSQRDEDLTDEQREEREADRRERQAHRRDRMERWVEDGNPQTGALLGEYFNHLRNRD